MKTDIIFEPRHWTQLTHDKLSLGILGDENRRFELQTGLEAGIGALEPGPQLEPFAIIDRDQFCGIAVLSLGYSEDCLDLHYALSSDDDSSERRKDQIRAITYSLGSYASGSFRNLTTRINNDAVEEIEHLKNAQFTVKGRTSSGLLIMDKLLEQPTMVRGKRSLIGRRTFSNSNFDGRVYSEHEENLNLLMITVHGTHPEKRITAGSRLYIVIDKGKHPGRFVIDGVSYQADTGDFFSIPNGSSYFYNGTMKLVEFNVPKDGVFSDEIVS